MNYVPHDRLSQDAVRNLALAASLTDYCVILTDPTGLIEWVNDGFTKLTGYLLTESLGRKPGTMLQGARTAPATCRIMHDALSTGQGFTVDVLNYRKDHSPFWLSMQVKPVHDETGAIVQFIGFGSDITASKNQERTLRESEALFRNIVNTAQEGIWLINNQGLTTYVNQRLATMLGYAEDEMLGKSMPEFMADEASTETERNLVRHKNGITETHNFLFCHKAGHDVWTSVATNPVVDDQGNLQGAVGLVTDISFKHASESKLASAHAENELLLATITTAIIGIDISENISRWNDAAERIFGIPRDQTIGKKIGECGLALDWGDIYLAMNSCISEGRSIDLHDTHFRRIDGKDGTLDISIVSSWSLRGDGLKGLGIVMMATDTTDRKHQEVQRQQGQKMESVGQLAAGVAHEINTPIQFIGDNLKFLNDSFNDVLIVLAAHAKLLTGAQQQCAQDSILMPIIKDVQAIVKTADLDFINEEIPKAISQSLDGVTRVAEIVRAMKEFSHPDAGEKKPTDLNKAIHTTLIVARNEYKYVADLVTDLAADLPLVPCIVGEFNQVILNLVVNAAHAIGDVVAKSSGKGTITISTRPAKEHVEIRICDTGTGIPLSAQSKIFDPFFTTKGVGKGTGQGLYIAHTVIAKKHGGSLTFETEINKGTTFIICLPLLATVQ